jgi:hypothetical protein
MATFNGSGIDGNNVLIDPTGLSVVTATDAQGAIAELDAASGGTSGLAPTLAVGNTTGGTNLVVTAGDEVQGQDGAVSAGSDLLLRGGDGQGGAFAGGDVVIVKNSRATQVVYCCLFGRR